MPVNYHTPTPEQLLPVAGVTLGTAAGRIKNWSRDDVILLSLSEGSRASGVFTRNRF
jgi:glutamate N-acetyltransferase/amino-acid N-acetyltransferase